MAAVGIISFMYIIYIQEEFFSDSVFFCFFPLYIYNFDPVNRKKDYRLGE